VTIFILRHGKAEPRRSKATDAARKLTGKGRRDVRLVLERARNAGMRVELALTSPLRRAVESAAIAVETLDPAPRLIETSSLRPNQPVTKVWENLPQTNTLLLVGHEPQLSRLVNFLLGAPGVRVHVKKGALVCIRLEQVAAPPRGTLEWMLTPRLARPHSREI
jgi:phosphohistidine phosphatase